MKMAIVNDDLIQHGGQERVLEVLLEAFPGASLYCSVISKEWKKSLSAKHINYHVSFLDSFPFVEKLSRYYAPFLFHHLAYESFDLSDYDLVIANSSRFAHTVVTKPNTILICYMHSPGRMFWLTRDYFKYERYNILAPLKKLGDVFVTSVLGYHRMIDYVAARRVDYFLANSSEARKRIAKFYRRDAEVVFPFIDTATYFSETHLSGDYYLVISRLVAWKRVDLAIKACLQSGKPLKIIGEGPARRELEKLSGNSPLIEFLGRVDEKLKIAALHNCKAVIQTQFEDFGLVPLEANASGKVVVGYGYGGILDTMYNGKTAEFFNAQTPESLAKALEKFEKSTYNPEECRVNAARFDRKVFISNMISSVTKLTVFPSVIES